MKFLGSFLAVVCLSFACTVYYPVLGEDKYEEQFNQSYEVRSGGTISLKEINGSIVISSWDQERVQVSAIKKGRSKSDIDEVTIEVAQEPNGLNIRTIYPNGVHHKNGVSVSYNLMVPRNINLERVETVNGSVNISDVRGSIVTHTVNGSIKVLNSSGSTNATTVNGSITVELASVEANKDMKLSTTNGSIKAYLPQNINAEVSAKTTNGGLHTDFPLTVQGKFTNKSIHGRLGSGGPLLSLSTVNGSISLLRAGRLES